MNYFLTNFGEADITNFGEEGSPILVRAGSPILVREFVRDSSSASLRYNDVFCNNQ